MFGVALLLRLGDREGVPQSIETIDCGCQDATLGPVELPLRRLPPRRLPQEFPKALPRGLCE
jgi:hypothetical protein